MFFTDSSWCIYFFNINLISYILISSIVVLLFFIKKGAKNIECSLVENDNGISDKQYIEAFENTGIYARLDAYYNIIKTNRNFCQIMHMVKEECQNINLFEFIDEQSDEIKETLKYKQIWDGLIVLNTPDKTLIHLNCSFTPIFDNNDEFKECIFLANDITDLVVSKSNIKKHLYTDTLTKLPNRLKLFTEKTFNKGV